MKHPVFAEIEYLTLSFCQSCDRNYLQGGLDLKFIQWRKTELRKNLIVAPLFILGIFIGVKNVIPH